MKQAEECEILRIPGSGPSFSTTVLHRISLIWDYLVLGCNFRLPALKLQTKFNKIFLQTSLSRTYITLYGSLQLPRARWTSIDGISTARSACGVCLDCHMRYLGLHWYETGRKVLQRQLDQISLRLIRSRHKALRAGKGFVPDSNSDRNPRGWAAVWLVPVSRKMNLLIVFIIYKAAFC